VHFFLLKKLVSVAAVFRDCANAVLDFGASCTASRKAAAEAEKTE